MSADEISAKSGAENKNKDGYEQEVLKQARSCTIIVQMILAAIFFAVQIFVGGGINYGLWALVYSVNMTTRWVKYIKLHHKHDLMTAIAHTVLVSIMSGCYIYDLIASSSIL